MRVYIFFLIAVFLTVDFAFAAIIEIPADYPAIQQGIDAGYNGDTVLVDPGEYIENINFNGKNIVVGSRFLTTGDTTYISDTIIDGDSLGPVVTFRGGEDSTAVIAGFTIRHGISMKGSGIYCINSSPLIRNNYITENIAPHEQETEGGGIYCGNSTAIILENTITENKACFGAGINCDSADAIISHNLISRNRADW